MVIWSTFTAPELVVSIVMLLAEPSLPSVGTVEPVPWMLSESPPAEEGRVSHAPVPDPVQPVMAVPLTLPR